MDVCRRVMMTLASGLAILSVTSCVLTAPLAPPRPTPTPPAVTPTPPPAATVPAAPAPPPTVTPEPVVTAIVSDLSDATIGVYGIRTKATFAVKAVGRKLTYKWQHRAGKGGIWKTISGAKSDHYTAKASVWASGTQFRVIVTGTKGKVTSRIATLTVQKPTRTPAKDAEAAFGLSGLRQGVDISAYQYEPSRKVNLKAVRAWTGAHGFAILRNGSGDRPVNHEYTDVCSGKPGKTKKTPATRDCAYPALADAAAAHGLALGHYWFNGWISSIDTTEGQLFAGGHTPTDSARLFVTWLKRDGRYTKSSTDPLVLDIEDGTSRVKTKDDIEYRQELRHWTPDEALEFLTAVREQLTSEGYQANLYVYMSANTALELNGWYYAWARVAGVARLWVASWGTDNGRVPATQPAVGPWLSRGGWSIWQYTSNGQIAGDGVKAIDADIAKADAWTPR